MQIKIICGQMEIIPGRPDLNYNKIVEIINKAKLQQADILLLPEMCLSGYLIGDLWEQQSFLDDCEYYGQKIIQASDNLCIIFGNVALERNLLNEDGHMRKYNAAFVCQSGKALPGYLGCNFVIKNSLPNYREFDDARYFHNLQKLCNEEKTPIQKVIEPISITVRNQVLKLGIFLCEDGWTDNYTVNVPQLLTDGKADLLCNLSCSPYTLAKNQKRNKLFSVQAKTGGIPLLYCNNVGIQNNGKNIFTYDGSSSVYDSQGKLAARSSMYEETLLECCYNSDSRQVTNTMPAACNDTIATIYQALFYGTKKFLEQCGIRKMTVGLSGGIDSAVTAVMYSKILGPENVLLINMPSVYNSAATKNIAEHIAKKLGTNYAVIPITQSCQHTEQQLTTTPVLNYADKTTFKLKLSGLISENIQARDRGARLLAAAAAAFGGAFSCNSNKAEIAIGYATFYGDICGAVAMIGDLWKHQVYALGKYLNESIYHDNIIPDELFTIKPSAELSSAQTVGVGGDPLIYEYHDYLFKAFIENWHKTSPADVLHWYKDGTLAENLGCNEEVITKNFASAADFIADLERWWKLFAGFAVAKRIQAPPIISLSKRAFGYDHREAQLTPYFSRRYYELKTELSAKK